MEIPTDGINYGGIIYLFGLIALFGMVFSGGTFNVAGIVLSSIDLNKTKRDNEPIGFSLTFLLINIFVVLSCLAYLPLLEVFSL